MRVRNIYKNEYIGYLLLGFHLGSTDVARWVPHKSPTRLDARCGHRRGCSRVGVAFEFFFFFSLAWLEFVLIWPDRVV